MTLVGELETKKKAPQNALEGFENRTGLKSFGCRQPQSGPTEHAGDRDIGSVGANAIAVTSHGSFRAVHGDAVIATLTFVIFGHGSMEVYKDVWGLFAKERHLEVFTLLDLVDKRDRVAHRRLITYRHQWDFKLYRLLLVSNEYAPAESCRTKRGDTAGVVVEHGHSGEGVGRVAPTTGSQQGGHS